MSRLIRFLSRPAVLAAGYAIILVFLFFILPAEAEKAAGYTPEDGAFDTTFFYPPSGVTERIAGYGEAGRAAYIRARWTFDLVFPLAYGFFCLTAMAFGISRLRSGNGSRSGGGSPPVERTRSVSESPFSIGPRLLLLPLAAVIFDLAENAAVTILMSIYPAQSPLLATAASLFTMLKWVAVSLSMILAVVLPPVALWRQRRRERHD